MKQHPIEEWGVQESRGRLWPLITLATARDDCLCNTLAGGHDITCQFSLSWPERAFSLESRERSQAQQVRLGRGTPPCSPPPLGVWEQRLAGAGMSQAKAVLLLHQMTPLFSTCTPTGRGCFRRKGGAPLKGGTSIVMIKHVGLKGQAVR